MWRRSILRSPPQLPSSTAEESYLNLCDEPLDLSLKQEGSEVEKYSKSSLPDCLLVEIKNIGSPSNNTVVLKQSNLKESLSSLVPEAEPLAVPIIVANSSKKRKIIRKCRRKNKARHPNPDVIPFSSVVAPAGEIAPSSEDGTKTNGNKLRRKPYMKDQATQTLPMVDVIDVDQHFYKSLGPELYQKYVDCQELPTTGNGIGTGANCTSRKTRRKRGLVHGSGLPRKVQKV